MSHISSVKPRRSALPRAAALSALHTPHASVGGRRTAADWMKSITFPGRSSTLTPPFTSLRFSFISAS